MKCITCEQLIPEEESAFNLNKCLNCYSAIKLEYCECGSIITGEDHILLLPYNVDTHKCLKCFFKEPVGTCNYRNEQTNCMLPTYNLDHYRCRFINLNKTICHKCFITVPIKTCKCDKLLSAVMIAECRIRNIEDTCMDCRKK